MDMEFQVDWGANPFYCGMANSRMYFSAQAGFLAGDLLSIDSRMGSRGVNLTRGGNTIEAMHLLGSLSPGVGIWTYIDASPGYKAISWSGGTNGDVVLKRLQYPVAWMGL
jgi:hypothetical protein